MNSKKKTYQYGINSEGIAASYLKTKGYEIIKSRYKTLHGEIDLIAIDKNYIVFIEVKARKKLEHIEVLTERQIKRISNAASQYLSENELGNRDVRFDLIIVQANRIHAHLENAWEFAI
jgi:putative endonuclease